MIRHLVRLLAATAVGLAAAAGPAYAIDHSKGSPGFCRSATGVTVVVDFQELGGTTIVRCFPSGGRGTGLDALKGAGFQIAGVQRWGEAFICRIENRPSAVEEIPIEGDENYQEACIDTPPAKGYWSYWHAGNNCPWVYSQWGVKNRDFIPGGFEAWSFSLNATAQTNPVPRVAAVRPGTEGRACDATDEPGPTTNDPDEQQPPRRDPPAAERDRDPTGPGDDRAPAAGGPPAARPGSTALPPPKLRASAGATAAADPADNVVFTGGEQAEDVNEVIRRQSGASRYAPWVAGLAVVVLVAATWWIARRRGQARNS